MEFNRAGGFASFAVGTNFAGADSEAGAEIEKGPSKFVGDKKLATRNPVGLLAVESLEHTLAMNRGHPSKEGQEKSCAARLPKS